MLILPMGMLSGCANSSRSSVKQDELSGVDQSVRGLVMERVLEEQAELREAQEKSATLAEEKAENSNA